MNLQALIGNIIIGVISLIGIFFFNGTISLIVIWSFLIVLFFIIFNIFSILDIRRQINRLLDYIKEPDKNKNFSEKTSRLYPEIANIFENIKYHGKKLELSSKKEKNQMIPVSLEKEHLESVLYSMSEGLIIYNMDLEVILINPALAQLLIPSNPIATGNLIQNPDDKLFFERCVDINKMKAIQKALKEQPDLPRSDIIELKNPHQFLKRYSSPLYDSNKNQIGHVIIYHDITQEVEAEHRRSEFITNASHELRTPVASIKVLLESLMVGAKDDPKLRDEFLNNLLKEVDRLHKLVNDLLDLARLESGREKLNITNLEINKVVEESVNTVQHLAKQRGVEINVNINPNLKNIKADKMRLGQIIINLVSNAVKFTPSGGKVFIEVNENKNDFEFKVSDTGIGIPAEDLPHIFDRFYQVDQGRTRKKMGGSGLGLTITKQAVDMHYGKIFVESNSNGTTFKFTIPKDITKFIPVERGAVTSNL